MAGMLSQFSDVQLADVYRYTTLQIICAAEAETAAAPASALRVQRLFRCPYLLIEAVTDFNGRHAAACIEKRKRVPTAECGDPWGSVGEQRLESETLAVMRSITRLVTERWNAIPREAAILAYIAACELRQWIREEYEIGRDTHAQAITSLRREQAGACRDSETLILAIPSASESPSTNAQQTSGKRPRGPTAASLLHQWYSDKAKRSQLLAAGSAAGIALLIGKSKSQVVTAGPIWRDQIKPKLAGQRSYARLDRLNDQLRH